MREIKFRQPLLNINGKFQEWFYWGFINNGFTAPLRFDQPNYEYTGKIDKKGKDIYRGDIIQHNDYPKWKGIVGQIDSGLWVLRGEGVADDLPLVRWLPDGQIIGNIYENPELCE
jgi:hypothetical protein